MTDEEKLQKSLDETCTAFEQKRGNIIAEIDVKKMIEDVNYLIEVYVKEFESCEMDSERLKIWLRQVYDMGKLKGGKETLDSLNYLS